MRRGRSRIAGAATAPATAVFRKRSFTLAPNALVEGQVGRVSLVLIGFDEAVAVRAGIADALRGDPCIRIGGGHDAAGYPCEALDLAALDRAFPGVQGSVNAFAVAGMFSVRNPEHEIAVRDRRALRPDRPPNGNHASPRLRRRRWRRDDPDRAGSPGNTEARVWSGIRPGPPSASVGTFGRDRSPVVARRHATPWACLRSVGRSIPGLRAPSERVYRSRSLRRGGKWGKANPS